MELKEKLVLLRKKNGLSQLELAEKLNVSRQAISKWEVGSTVPTTDNLIAISRIYSISVDYLMNQSDQELTDNKHQENSFGKTELFDKENNESKIMPQHQYSNHEGNTTDSHPNRNFKRRLIAAGCVCIVIVIGIMSVFCYSQWTFNPSQDILIKIQEMSKSDNSLVIESGDFS